MGIEERLQDVTVIVVSYNSAHCLPSLAAGLKDCPHVLLVDNGSEDSTLADAAHCLPRARCIALGRNLGFGAANNRALVQVQTPFALLLNPDCEITPEAIAHLCEAALRWPDAAIVAPQLTDAQGQAEVNYRWPSQRWRSRGPGAEAPACVGFVCGAALLLRLSAFERIGFFDERFFLYYEDDDLCTRVVEAGRSIVLDPAVRVVHRSRGSVRGPKPWHSEYLRGYHHAQSKLIYSHKHTAPERARRQRHQLLWQTALALPLRLIAFSPRLAARMVGRLCGAYHWRPHG